MLIMKSKKVRYKFTMDEFNNNLNPDLHFKDFVEKAVHTTCPFIKSLKSFLFDQKNIPSFFSEEKTKYYISGKTYLPAFDSSYTTAKFCPGIKDLLKNSYLIKLPFDCHITLNHEGEFFWNSPSEEYHFNISSHRVEQFYTEGSSTLFNNRINIKFELPIYLSGDSSFIFLQPSYHNEVPWEIVNGVMSSENAKFMKLNIVTFFPRPAPGKFDHHFIKAGTVLSYIWFPQTTKFIFDKNISNNRFKKTFFPTW